MNAPRIGSLFTGTGALDLAALEVFGGGVVWHSQFEPPDKNGREDRHQFAAKILARHWPTVPNLGDITAIDWPAVAAEHGPVDIVTAGFPCQDVSSAGKRAGLTPGTRSGLWAHMARAIAVLRPKLVIIENVPGLLSATADRGMGSDAEAVDGGSGAAGVLRALGAVLGDLAILGFDAEWCRLGASDVGAPHPRRRVFVLAWLAVADADGGESERRGVAGVLGSQATEESGEGRQRERAGHAAGGGGEAVADAAHLGHERGWGARGGRPGSADGDLAAAHACGPGLEVGRVEPDRHERAPAERGRGEPAADTTGDGRGEGRAESARVEGRPDAALGGGADLDWGGYGPAIARWEHILGRRAPRPVDDLGRLSPHFTEWMMGLPDGWVTGTEGLTRGAMLKALGNGVVPQQAAAALRLLHGRMPAEARLPLADCSCDEGEAA